MSKDNYDWFKIIGLIKHYLVNKKATMKDNKIIFEDITGFNQMPEREKQEVFNTGWKLENNKLIKQIK